MAKRRKAVNKAQKKFHFVHDSETKARIKAGTARDKEIQAVRDEAALRTLTEVKDFETSPTNYHRQMGRSMSADAFEKKIAPILPPCVKIMPDPRTRELRHFYLIFPDGEMMHLLAFPGEIIPEHTICYTKYEDVVDMDVNHIDRKDLPPHEYNPKSGTWDFDTSSQPLAGMKRVALMDQIALKGWRQILLQLISYKVITVAQAEAIFGADDRKEWGHKTGKIYAPTIW